MAGKIITRIAIAGWVIGILGPVLALIALDRYTDGTWPFPPRPVNNMIQTPTDRCQYPSRPLVNGQCDNSDPCDPETIKDPNLYGNCRESLPGPVEEAIKPLILEEYYYAGK